MLPYQSGAGSSQSCPVEIEPRSRTATPRIKRVSNDADYPIPGDQHLSANSEADWWQQYSNDYAPPVNAPPNEKFLEATSFSKRQLRRWMCTRKPHSKCRNTGCSQTESESIHVHQMWHEEMIQPRAMHRRVRSELPRVWELKKIGGKRVVPKARHLTQPTTPMVLIMLMVAATLVLPMTNLYASIAEPTEQLIHTNVQANNDIGQIQAVGIVTGMMSTMCHIWSVAKQRFSIITVLTALLICAPHAIPTGIEVTSTPADTADFTSWLSICSTTLTASITTFVTHKMVQLLVVRNSGRRPLRTI